MTDKTDKTDNAPDGLPPAGDSETGVRPIVLLPGPDEPTEAEAAIANMVNLCNLMCEIIGGLHVAHQALAAFQVFDLAAQTEAVEKRLAERWYETVGLLSIGGAPDGTTVH